MNIIIYYKFYIKNNIFDEQIIITNNKGSIYFGIYQNYDFKKIKLSYFKKTEVYL